jgi:hypothetical protein
MPHQHLMWVNVHTYVDFAKIGMTNLSQKYYYISYEPNVQFSLIFLSHGQGSWRCAIRFFFNGKYIIIIIIIKNKVSRQDELRPRKRGLQNSTLEI